MHLVWQTLWNFQHITSYILFADVMVGYEAITYTYSEGVGSASIRIMKVGDTDLNTTVSFSTVNGTAVSKNLVNEVDIERRNSIKFMMQQLPRTTLQQQ